MRADALTAERIGLDWLRAAVAPVSESGRTAEDGAMLFGPADGAAARSSCADVLRLSERLRPDGVAHLRAALRRAPEPRDILERARMGDALSDVDLFALGQFTDVLAAIERAWRDAGGTAAALPQVPAVAELLAPGRRDGAFYLDDAFAAELAAARSAFAAADAASRAERERLAAALAPALGFVPDGDEFIVMRDAVAGVPAGAHVVRETPSYRLLTVALDDSAQALDAVRAAALAALAQCESAVRLRLSEEAARLAGDVNAAARDLGALDRTLARVAFTQRWGGCMPQIADDRFAFSEATFAPLCEALEREGLPYTPISLELHGAAVITGPNMGGKTAALATCGFVAACVALGIPPPARIAAVPLLARAAWIGGERDVAQSRLLSAFAEEVVRARDVLGDVQRPALVLIDEFARTTGPREGCALLSALVEAFGEHNAFALVATHFDGIAARARVAHLTVAGLHGRALSAQGDVHAALDALGRAMDYRIIAVDPGARSESGTLALARVLGLDAAVVERAHILLREEC
ncbi:MAG: hypothetical protein ABR591_10175 [Candidatus Velthaea sp.]